MTDVCQLPAHELVCLMSNRTLTCRDVVEVHLAHIDEVNPALNALVEAANPETCLAAADEADGRAARGEPLGKVHGLPVVIKDVMKVAGLMCSGGVARWFGLSRTRTRRRCRGCAPRGPSCSG